MTDAPLYLHTWPPAPGAGSPADAADVLRRQGAQCSSTGAHGWRVVGLGLDASREALRALPHRNAVICDAITHQARRLLLFDADATIVRGESLDALAEAYGVGEQVAALTAEGMSGELDFHASVDARLALIRGCPLQLVHDTAHSLVFTTGAADLLRSLIAAGHIVAVVSGGFHELLDPLLGTIPGLLVRANRLSYADGCLTGTHEGDVWDAAGKARLLQDLSRQNGIPVTHSIAVGDGANDALMLGQAGISIAFQGKPAAKAAAQAWLDHDSLAALHGIASPTPAEHVR